MNFCDLITEALIELDENDNPEEAFVCAMRAYEMINDPHYDENRSLDALSEIANCLLDRTEDEELQSEESEFELRKKRAKWFVFAAPSEERFEGEIVRLKETVRAAINGDAASQYALGQEMKDEFCKDSFFWINASAAQNYAPAIYELGIRCLNKTNVYNKNEYKNACSYFSKAANLSFFPAQMKLAQIYYDIGRPEEAFKWVKVAECNPQKKSDNNDYLRIIEIEPLEEISKRVENYFRDKQLADKLDSEAISKIADYYAGCYDFTSEEYFLELQNSFTEKAASLGDLPSQEVLFNHCWEEDESDLDGMCYWYDRILENPQFNGNKKSYLEKIEEVKNEIFK